MDHPPSRSKEKREHPTSRCCGFFRLFGRVLKVVLPNVLPVFVAGIFRGQHYAFYHNLQVSFSVSHSELSSLYVKLGVLASLLLQVLLQLIRLEYLL